MLLVLNDVIWGTSQNWNVWKGHSELFKWLRRSYRAVNELENKLGFLSYFKHEWSGFYQVFLQQAEVWLENKECKTILAKAK